MFTKHKGGFAFGALNVNKSTDQVDSRAKPCYGRPVSVQKLVVSRVSGRQPWWTLTYASFDAQSSAIHFFVCASKIQPPARAARVRQNVFAFLLTVTSITSKVDIVHRLGRFDPLNFEL